VRCSRTSQTPTAIRSSWTRSSSRNSLPQATLEHSRTTGRDGKLRHVVTQCRLCLPTIEPLLNECEWWRVVLNREQSLLGKSMIVLPRHAELLSELEPNEWASLQMVAVQTTNAIRNAFAVDHFNYAFLQNVDRHIHLHVIPRYGSVWEFAGLTFHDDRYGDHYEVPTQPRFVASAELNAVADAVRQHWS
jgi:diadenosine tetraphosphate (Ap4A) HIT family hydrolase